MAALRNAEFWNLYPPELRPFAAPQPVAGGLSDSAVWRCECSAGHFALKRLADACHHVAQVRAAALLPFVPALQRNLRGQTATLLGDELWELSAWRPGTPAEDPRPVAEAAAEGLAQWHRAFAGGPPDIGASRIGTAANDRMRLWREVQPPSDGAANDRLGVAARALAPRMPEWLALCARPQPQVVCHGDPNRGNLLFQRARLTGLIDFAALRIDTPLLDLVRWCGDAAPGDDAFRAATLAAYGRHAPLPDDADRIAVAFEITGAVIGALRWDAWVRAPGLSDARLAAARARRTMLCERVERWAQREG